jgi:hypothetical protein
MRINLHGDEWEAIVDILELWSDDNDNAYGKELTQKVYDGIQLARSEE